MNLANATDIRLWAHRRTAQADLPLLVRRLIAATADGITLLDMKSGEGVAIGGWDGHVRATGPTLFVPSGDSWWEMGTDARPAAKATTDYTKRETKPGPATPATDTYAVVTPRLWSKKDEWIQEREEGPWKQILVYDAHSLEEWLYQAPAVHVWFSWLIGKDPQEARSLDSWWEAWSTATRSPLPADVLLSGRPAEAERLIQRLGGSPSAFTVASESPQEAQAFVAAALSQSSAQYLMERTLVVSTPQAWRRVSLSSSPLILMPRFEDPDIGPALASGHHVITTAGPESSAGSGIRLPRLRRSGVERVLLESGMGRDEATGLATLCRRSLMAFRRRIAHDPAAHSPDWSRGSAARLVAATLLAGTWEEGAEGDQQVLGDLAGTPYPQLARELTALTIEADPPIRRIGGTWRVSDKTDAYRLVSQHISGETWALFAQTAVSVLTSSETIPPPPGDAWAAFNGPRPRFSQRLKTGVADTLALIAALSEEASTDSGTAAGGLASSVVRSLFDASPGELSQRWNTLADVLPLLAEAAPNAFLSAVDRDSETDQGAVFSLFQEDENTNTLGPSSPHPSLLWALETLTWSPDHRAQALLALARIARLEPGGRMGNRPHSSIKSAMWVLMCGSQRGQQDSVAIMDVLRRREPYSAWRLLLDTIAMDWAGTMKPSTPAHRDWAHEEWEQSATRGVPASVVDTFIHYAIEDAGGDPQRWNQLLDAAASGVPDLLEATLNAVEGLDPEQFDEQGRYAMKRSLASIADRHAGFQEAYWSMPPDKVSRMRDLSARFEVTNPLLRHRWLFRQGMLDAFEGRTRTDTNGAVDVAQDAALSEVLEHTGWERLPAWIESVTADGNTLAEMQIGHTLGRIHPDRTDLLIEWLDSDARVVQQTAAYWARQIARDKGQEWTTWALDHLSSSALASDPTRAAQFLLQFYPSRDLWKRVDADYPHLASFYWANISPHNLHSSGPEAMEQAHRLFAANRPRAALQVLRYVHHGDPVDLPVDLLADILEAVAKAPGGPFDASLTGSIGEHLTFLDENDLDRDRLMTLEWRYLPLFRYDHRSSSILHRRMTQDPAFFTEVVATFYKPASRDTDTDGEPESEPDADAAINAYALLDSWRTVPGTSQDGTLDADALIRWVDQAIAELAAVDRLQTGLTHIGHVLRYAASAGEGTYPDYRRQHPDPPPDTWPPPAVCQLIEHVASDSLEEGFYLEVYNSRGVTSRGLAEGGAQERALADRYERFAQAARIEWPRTAAMLRGIATSYRSDAARNDRNADLTQDEWS